MVLLKIDRQAASPVFMQITNQLRQLIENGALKVGARLPATRSLAQALGVNRTTVCEAYQQLWALGYLESRSGSYTRMRSRGRIVQPRERSKSGAIRWSQATPRAREKFFKQMRGFAAMANAVGSPGEINLSRLDMDSRLFPLEEFRRSLQRVFAAQGASLLNYGEAQGYLPLREYIAERSRIHGLSADASEVLITNGSQQAIDLVSRLLAPGGETVVIESPTYANVIQILQYHQCRIIGIPMRPDGMDLGCLRKALDHRRPMFVYTMPNFQNPTGVTTSQIHREQLLAICDRHRVPLVEDGFEEEMKYFGKVSLPIKSMDQNQVVIYLGTFSKVLFPGARVGWIIADRECIHRLLAIKRMSDLTTAPLLQAALCDFCRRELFDLHVRRMHRIFRKRLQVALAALNTHLPAKDVSWTEPAGAFLIWVKFKNARIAASRFYRLCAEERVRVSPGAFYFPKAEGNASFRVSISNLDEAEIQEGICRLGRAIKRALS
ncbi:MAG: PLP-dependent aminotransferase family protein [Acidobacteriia bacterium]|nr:PLP-dependent aminotransferase family protein [Terriglobia bacterium]